MKTFSYIHVYILKEAILHIALSRDQDKRLHCEGLPFLIRWITNVFLGEGKGKTYSELQKPRCQRVAVWYIVQTTIINNLKFVLKHYVILWRHADSKNSHSIIIYWSSILFNKNKVVSLYVKQETHCMRLYISWESRA